MSITITDLGQKIHYFILIRRTILGKEAEKNGLFPGQPGLLICLSKNEGCTQNDVARELGVSPASIASSVRRLSRSGFLEKRINSSDLRCNKLYLTPKGKKAAEICLKEGELFNESILGSLSDSEKEELGILMDKLSRNAEKSL